jgi:hypothetical protein
MSFLKTLGTLFGIKPRPALPVSFSPGTRFFFYPLHCERNFFILSPDLGWCRMDKGEPEFVRQTAPPWAACYTVEMDESTFRDLFQSFGKYWSKADREDQLRRDLSTMEERHEIPHVPTHFPEGAQFWLKESSLFLYMPEEGWYAVTSGRMCFRGEEEPAEISRSVRIDEVALRQKMGRS